MLAATCLALAACGIALDTHRRQSARLQTLASRGAEALAPVLPAASPAQDNAARLMVFERLLLAHEDIPTLVQDLLGLAAQSGLAIRKGEYKLVLDPDGGFARYRMNLPVQGPAPAVQRFVQQALAQNPALALEGVQFKRDKAEAVDGEAKVQWVVFTRLPAEGRRTAAAAAASGGHQ